MSQSDGAVCGWPDSLLNGTEMGALIRGFDWSRTPLGAIERWPQSLRDHVGMVVDNTFPMYIFWGAGNTAIYNDAYIPLAGDKHPAMLGMRTEDVWREVWTDICPLVEQAKRGRPVTLRDLELTVLRHGFWEQAYATFSYAPLRDESGAIAGALGTITETTMRVLANRRLETLRQLAFRSSTALSEPQSIARIREALEGSADLPFALVYLATEGSPAARLAARIGTLPFDPPEFDDALRFDEDSRVLAVPIGGPDRQNRIGTLVAGISLHLRIDAEYREFISLVAAQIGNAVAAARVFVEERARAESMQVTRTLEKIGLFAESGQQLFWMTNPEGWIDWFHQSWYDYTGQTYEEAKGWGWKAVHHPDDLPEVLHRWAESLNARVPFEMTFRLRGKDGRYRWFLTRAVPEFDEGGNVVRWYGTNTNIDSERRAAQQYDFLAGLGQRLVQNPDRRSALRALSEALVPSLADWTLVNLADAHGSLILSAAHHRDPEKTRAMQPFIGMSYERPDRTNSAAQVLRTGRPAFLETVSPKEASARVIDAFAPIVESLGMRSIVVVPIVANGTIYGTFHAGAAEDDKVYAQRDVPFFEEIGRRMGFALQNADAYERERRIAHAFQSAALPSALPHVPGMHFSSLYEPAGNEANVGGDFYDAFRLLDGRVVLSIGDVAGAGLRAAATMAALRQSIRAVASVNPDPDMLLKAADGVLSDSTRAPFASAFVAVIDPLTFSIQYANAGHPPPVMRNPDGSLAALDTSDLLLGISGASQYANRRVGKVVAQPGSLLVLYTDGLTEATKDLLAGEARLRDAVRRVNVSRDASNAARDMWQTVLDGGVVAHDDVAIIAVLFDAPLIRVHRPDIGYWQFACEDGGTAHRVRNEMVSALHAASIRQEDVFAAEVVFSELVGNVFRHAETSLEVVLDLTQEAPVLHVLDCGEGFSLNPKLPADAFAERGRGLYIVTQMSREFTVTPRTTSPGSHARAVLHGRINRRGVTRPPKANVRRAAV